MKRNPPVGESAAGDYIVFRGLDLMADIKHDLSIAAPVAKVFAAVSEPAFLDEWWTETCRGTVATDAEYELGFGPEYQWRARVSIFEPEREFELTITDATDDWIGTKVGFVVVEEGSGTPSVSPHGLVRNERTFPSFFILLGSLSENPAPVS
ncbi:MAG: SRPBCC domain-containing protein [Acidobacteria bacterium]|nr:SRPBCC domain-containing protein [Acidobacteriota bacterium]